MARPQSEHLQRSGNTPIDPDHIATEVETQPHAPRDEPGGGPIPPENQPGHHPAQDQDKPDLDQFAKRLGVTNPDERDANGDAGGDGGKGDAGGKGGAGGDGDAGGDGSTNPASRVVSTALGVAGRARDLVRPVGRAMSERVGKVTGAVDSYRHLAERVERLEATVAELERDSTTTG